MPKITEHDEKEIAHAQKVFTLYHKIRAMQREEVNTEQCDCMGWNCKRCNDQGELMIKIWELKGEFKALIEESPND